MCKEDGADVEVHELEPLKFRPYDRQPTLGLSAFQKMVALVVIFVSSQLFVEQLDAMAPWLGISLHLVALLLSPIATELLEILNIFIWVRQGKQTLALSNISCAIMMQARMPTALVLIFIPWMLDMALIWAGAINMMSIYVLLRKQILMGGRLVLFRILYLVFAAGLALMGVW